MRRFIFDEAGTGKTKRSMDLLDDAEHILVICPASVIRTAWLPQIRQWSHGKALTIEDYKRIGWPEDYRFLIVSYNMADRLDLVPDGFSLIVDESHMVKNPRSSRSKTVQAISRLANDVLMLTGTPAPKDLEDLYGQAVALFPYTTGRTNILGDPWRTIGAFRLRYGTPYTMNVQGRTVVKYAYSLPMVEQACRQLRKLVLDVRRGGNPLPQIEWLPSPKTEQEDMAISQWTNTHQLAEDVYAASASAAAIKLAQFDDGFAYKTETRGEAYWFGVSKLKTVYDWAKRREDPTPLLVWARFKAVTDEIYRTWTPCTDAKTFLTMTGQEREKYRLVIANPQSMGTGVDGLQHLMKDQIWLDLPWTYADWEQANRRLIRRGSPYQGRQRILVPDTPWDRKVVDVIEGRKTLDDIIKTGNQLGEDHETRQ